MTPFHQPRVTDLELFENNLVGYVPDALGQLTSLERLLLFGNQLSGKLPRVLMQRWLQGPLVIKAEASLFSDVTEIDFESAATGTLCAKHRIILRADNSAVQYSELCRNTTPEDRTTFCEVKQGRAWGFTALAFLLDRNGFFRLRPEYDRNITHASFEQTRVKRGGKTFEVSNYANAGPFELWTIQTAIEGVAATAQWEKTSTQDKCPRWQQSQ